jgi:hypothetical protein
VGFDMVEEFYVASFAGLGFADAFGNGSDFAMFVSKESKDAVGFAVIESL